MGFVQKLILACIVGILLIAIIILIFTSLSKKGDIEACRLSVRLQSGTEVHVAGISAGSMFDVNCNKRYVYIYPDRVEEGNSPENTNPIDIFLNGKKVKRFGELSDYIVNYAVAEEMKICYYEFGEGKVDVFPNNKKWFNADSDVCFICSEIVFKDVPARKYTGFMSFIRTASIDNLKLTYLQYFNQPSLSEKTWEEFTNHEYNNDAENKIFFDSKNPGKYDVVFRKTRNPISKNGYYVYVIPSDKLNDVCKQVAV